ncbi:MAG TPA: hypothetical protein VK574_17705, partial [Terracidiphilus sp.]|nr:hypothetical protein [Terracidiphilus sp.]
MQRWQVGTKLIKQTRRQHYAQGVPRGRGLRSYIAATKSGSTSGALTSKSCAIRAAIPVYIDATWNAF